MPDVAANPNLAFAGTLMAILDGIRNKTHPGPPLDKDIYDMSPEELKGLPRVPQTLDDALAALERDHEFLLQRARHRGRD